MLKIGEFSVLSQISIYMLRHYDEIGLLIPEQVDEFTGYRYYSERQLPIAGKIQALKSMGLSLNLIKEILTKYTDNAGLKTYLELQAIEQKEKIEHMQKQLNLLKTTIVNLDHASDIPLYSVALKRIPAHYVISVRGIIETSDKEAELWERLAQERKRQKIQFANPAWNIAVFHDEGFQERDLDVEIQQAVIGKCHDTDVMKCKKVEEITAATLTFKGRYELLPQANEEKPIGLTERTDQSMKERVCCLYRVSTDKQVDYNDKNQADIPMQRRKCHQFADQMGWVIVHEEQEDGVSGHKVRAENRDKIQTIKELAKQGKFDILLVFMFDRIGRIADETPFVVEWFVKNGIRVWSTQEGEQRFDNHTDKLTNYIRFWQADGESEKTSICTKTALGQLVEDGGFKGGLAPYGYDLVRSGRFNKRKHEVYELVVNEAEAAVVRIIFDKYVHEGFGAQRLATYLNNLGYRARTGKMWHHASIRGIICNLTYTGVLRSGESRSQVLPHLQIIDPELFEAAQSIRTARANSAEQERRVPLNTRGQSLLAGNVFCGHCGARLSLTTNGKAYPCKDDPNRIVKRVRYVCYGKTRKQTECDGQTGYTAHILDGIIDKLVRQIFERMKAIPKSEVVNIRYREKMEERKSLLQSVRTDYAKAAAEVDMLKAEVIKSLRGESAFSQDLLSSLIADAETKCLEVQRQMEAAQAAYDEGQAVMADLNSQYDDIITWADMYDTASIEAKKMIVNCLIKRVEVYRDYKLHIDFNIDLEQFSLGMDIITIAA